MRHLAEEQPRLAHTFARLFFRMGNPWPYVSLQWGDLISGTEFLSDRKHWESGKGGRFLILDSYQQDMIEAVADHQHRIIALKGNTGCGKGAAGGIVVNAYFDCWRDSRIIITRDTHQTAVSIMFGEVKKWWNRTLIKPRARMQTGGAVDPKDPQHEIIVANPMTDEGFSGVHGEHVMFLFDEATAITESRFNMAYTQAHKIIALANPRTTSGAFRRFFPTKQEADPDVNQTRIGDQGLIRCITIDGRDCTNVKHGCLDKPVSPIKGIQIDDRYYPPGTRISDEDYEKRRPIIPGQVSYDMWIGICNHPDPRYVAVYGHGKFPDEDPQYQLILGGWLASPFRKWARWNQLQEIARGRASRQPEVWWSKGHRYPHALKLLERIMPVEAFGLDVARSKLSQGDATMLAAGGRRGVRDLHEAHYASTTAVVSWVIKTIDDQYSIDLTLGAIPIGVDMDGLGAGVGDELRAKGCFVIECRGNTASDIDPKRYGNTRAQRYGELAARLNPDGVFDYDPQTVARDDPGFDVARHGCGRVFALPDDAMLTEELLAHEKVYKGSDDLRFWVTPKTGDTIVDRSVTPARVIEPLDKRLGRSPDRSDVVSYLFEAINHVGSDLGDWIDQLW